MSSKGKILQKGDVLQEVDISLKGSILLEHLLGVVRGEFFWEIR